MWHAFGPGFNAHMAPDQASTNGASMVRIVLKAAEPTVLSISSSVHQPVLGEKARETKL